MTDQERLEHIKRTKGYLLDLQLQGHIDWLIEKAERVHELEKERSEWKGKYSVLKRKYKGLQRKMNNRWRYNRAVENESNANRTVLEKFREENQRYKKALEEIKRLTIYDAGTEEEVYEIATNALEGDTNA